ncbi:MAG: hypothetical protein E6Q88_14785 [Lysobacteraceae bacterium]|nr:MAG: hypothetical protein E6Q88_14785 [Xanthomonadaceae bacterium]
MGLGVTGMHYSGMAAMLMPADIHYDTTIVAVSALIAVVASIAALWLAFHMRGWLQMLGSALVMGVAVCGMHYTGMYAASFVPNGKGAELYANGLSGANLGTGIFVVATVLLVVSLALSILRQRKRAAVEIGSRHRAAGSLPPHGQPDRDGMPAITPCRTASGHSSGSQFVATANTRSRKRVAHACATPMASESVRCRPVGRARRSAPFRVVMKGVAFRSACRCDALTDGSMLA